MIAFFALSFAVAFLPNLRGAFVWDDVTQIEKNRSLVEDGGVWTILSSDLWGGAGARGTQLYHPLPMLSFRFQAALFGISIVAFRIGNLLVHLCNVLCVFLLLEEIVAARGIALFFACVFGIHPSVTEPVMWLTGRHDTMAAFFALMSIVVWPVSPGQRVSLRMAAATLSAGAAFLSKEPYIVVLVLLPLFDGMAHRSRLPLKRRVIGYALLPTGVIAVFALRAALGISSGSAQLSASLSTHWVSFATLVWHYLVQIGMFSNGITTSSFVPLSFCLAAVVLSGFGAVLVICWRLWRRGIALFGAVTAGMMWFLIALLPHTMSLPIIGMYGNRYAYFPMVGLFISAAAATQLLRSYATPRLERVAFVAGLCLLAALGGATHLEAARWHDALTLYGADLKRAPDDPKTLYHYGHAVRTRWGCERALVYFERAAALEPSYWRALHNQAGCLIRLGRYREAEAPALKAYHLDEMNPRSLYNLGIVRIETGDKTAGRALIEKALAIDPEYALAQKALDAFGVRAAK